MSDNMKLAIGLLVFMLILGLVGRMELDTYKAEQRQQECMTYSHLCP